MLRDANDPTKWADGSPRSQGSAFNVLDNYIPSTDSAWATMEAYEGIRRRASKSVQVARDAGKDMSVGALITQGKHGGAYTKAAAKLKIASLKGA